MSILNVYSNFYLHSGTVIVRTGCVGFDVAWLTLPPPVCPDGDVVGSKVMSELDMVGPGVAFVYPEGDEACSEVTFVYPLVNVMGDSVTLVCPEADVVGSKVMSVFSEDNELGSEVTTVWSELDVAGSKVTFVCSEGGVMGSDVTCSGSDVNLVGSEGILVISMDAMDDPLEFTLVRVVSKVLNVEGDWLVLPRSVVSRSSVGAEFGKLFVEV